MGKGVQKEQCESTGVSGDLLQTEQTKTEQNNAACLNEPYNSSDQLT